MSRTSRTLFTSTLLAAAALLSFAAPALAKKASSPCPAGQHWVNTCPAGVECVMGGHCAPDAAHTPKCAKGQHWVDTCPPGVECIMGGHCAKADAAARKCPPGQTLQQVQCVRAPCPPVCMPAKKGAKAKKTCPPGQALHQVQCIRAPCPEVCEPVR